MRKMIASAITILGLVAAMSSVSLAQPIKKSTKKSQVNGCPLKGTPYCPINKCTTTAKKNAKKGTPDSSANKTAAK